MEKGPEISNVNSPWWGQKSQQKPSWTEIAVKTVPAALSYELEMLQVLKFPRGVIKVTALFSSLKPFIIPPPR